jgi:diguanylate cyclase (GGDEF)-like protein
MLKDLLGSWGYEVQLANDGTQALAALQADDAPRLAIVDGTMPGLTGPELCQAVRANNCAYVYIILLSASNQEIDVAHGFELGADDYLCKPFKEFELHARLRVGIRIIEAQNALLASQEQLRFQATHDSLTRIWNRAGIVELLRKELSRTVRSGEPLSICLADLDHFKTINDTYGHLAGDDVLRAAGERMCASLRPYDSVGRYGGEEFLVALPGCTVETTVPIAERLRKSIGGQAVVSGNDAIHVTVSLGVCEWQAHMELKDLLRNADLALYRAKDSGRNRVVVAQPAISATQQSEELSSIPTSRPTI